MKLKINGSEYMYFNDFTLTKTLDSVGSTFAFALRFDPDNKVHKDLLRPLAYHKVQVFGDDNELFLTGLIVSHEFKSTSVTDLVQVSGYSLGGVLEDCTISFSDYPLESLNLSLKEIAQKLLKPFGLRLIISKSVEADCNHKYAKSVADPSGSIKEYLSKLAAQRNVILSHDKNGNILFTRPDIRSASKVFYNPNNTLAISSSFNGQGMHSSITVIRQPADDDDSSGGLFGDDEKTSDSVSNKASGDGGGGLFDDDKPGVSTNETISNPFIKAYRPLVQVLSSGGETDTANGAKNVLASELRNLKFSIELNRWDNVFPGDIIEIQEPRVYLYKRSRFIIESVTKNQDSEKKNMSISAVLPETFTGDIPKNIFL